MWLLHFLPDSFLLYIVNLTCILGAGLIVAGFVVSMFNPWFYRWRTLLQILGIAVLVIGIYWKGGYGVEMEWRDRVAELEAKVAAAESKSKETNVVIKEKVVTKIKHVKDVRVKIQKEIVEKEKLVNGQCVVTEEFVNILNKAAEKPQAVVEVKPAEVAK